MSNYIVSARKYRPMRFDEVVGQKHVSKTLKNALKTDHLGHSFLFCGPRGVGKTTSARILAKVLNCENRTEDFEPCNECNSCLAFNQNQSFNIYELDAASNNSVENIRDLVDQVRFPPQQGQYKVYIIDEVHMLSQSAFNAFLKTLEEPPHYAIFILATTEKHKIIPTILSRCQIFDFNRVQVNDIVNHLQMICEQEGISAEESALHIIAQKADGALRDALSIFDRIVSFSGDNISYKDVTESLNLLDYDTFFKLTNSLLLQDKNAVLLQFDEVLNHGFDGDQVMLGLAEHFRNLLVAKNANTLPLLEVAPDVRDRFQEQGALAKDTFLLNALNIANDCDVKFKQAKNKRLHVELALMKICYLGQLEKNVALAEDAATEQVKKNDEQLATTKKLEKNQPTDKVIDQSKSDLVKPPTNPPKPSNQQEGKPKPNAENTLQDDSLAFEPTIEKKADSKSESVEENQPINKTGKTETEEITAVTDKQIASKKQTKNQAKQNRKPALSFRLSQLNKEVEKRKQQAEEKNKPPEKEEVVDFSENPVVSEENVAKAWYSLTDKVKSQSLAKGIADSTISYQDNKLTATVKGKVIRDFLKEHHNLIVETIQEGTGLKRFLFEIECVEIEVQNEETYTKEEQLKFIQEQNPAIKKLCDDFDLQINYD